MVIEDEVPVVAQRTPPPAPTAIARRDGAPESERSEEYVLEVCNWPKHRTLKSELSPRNS